MCLVETGLIREGHPVRVVLLESGDFEITD